MPKLANFGQDPRSLRPKNGWSRPHGEASLPAEQATTNYNTFSLKEWWLSPFPLNIFDTNVPLEARLGGLIHSDRGSTYTGRVHCRRARELGLNVSMSRSGNCIDNAPTESFFGHMKDELPNTRNMTYEELRETINGYIIDHNTVRKQWHREKMSPVGYRKHLLCA